MKRCFKLVKVGIRIQKDLDSGENKNDLKDIKLLKVSAEYIA